MIREAIPLEDIRAASSGEYMTSAVFTISELPGLWRQIPRDGRQGLRTTVEGAMVAHLGEERLIELVRWLAAEEALSEQAGLDVIQLEV